MEESKPALDLFNKGKNNKDMTFFRRKQRIAALLFVIEGNF